MLLFLLSARRTLRGANAAISEETLEEEEGMEEDEEEEEDSEEEDQKDQRIQVLLTIIENF